MSGQTWTPAPKKGIVPLHPLTFGMLLGRAFSALRHNPKVLFGFAVVIQLIATLAMAGVMGVVLFTTFSRLETVSPSSPDFEAVFAGTILANILAGLGVGVASVAFTALMQGVVAAEVGYAAVGVKASLGALWRKMAPAFWRLAGFASLSVLFVFGLVAIVVGVIAAFVAGGLGSSAELIGLTVIIVLLILAASIPLMIWLSTKLLLVPAILVLERARFREALVRSWRLTRGRFWVAFGVTALISVIMGLAMQVVSIPVSLLSTLFGSVIAPTGSPDTGAIFGFVFALLAPQILLLVLQAITLVVQSTGSALVYLDCRMRYEGLDQALISHVEKRDLGWSEEQLGDPYEVDPARAVSSAPPPRQTPEYATAPVAYGYPPQQYAAAPYPPQAYPAPAYPGSPPTPPYAAAPAPQPTSSVPQQGFAPPPPAHHPPMVASPPTDSPWAAPGSDPA
ncbi:hypothetical protein [Microbacterium aurantiacum]|uniref:hypothetical protein n=1 Tax=Microbacterium aurantiacum TaxID=162393 RepID=UPI000C80828F|nr:hypothetical protein [Microbacterium aurantiacum]